MTAGETKIKIFRFVPLEIMRRPVGLELALLARQLTHRQLFELTSRREMRTERAERMEGLEMGAGRGASEAQVGERMSFVQRVM